MQVRLNDLLSNPDTFSPDYSDRYRALLEHCSDLTAHSAYAMTMLLGKDSSRGYRELPTHPSFEFPAAHVPDLGARSDGTSSLAQLSAQMGFTTEFNSCSGRIHSFQDHSATNLVSMQSATRWWKSTSP